MWRFEIRADAQAVRVSAADQRGQAKDPGLNSAELYKLNPTGRIVQSCDADTKSPYTEFPKNYEHLITNELKTLLEFPGYTADNFSQARKAYAEWGQGRPRHTRFGWLHNG